MKTVTAANVSTFLKGTDICKKAITERNKPRKTACNKILSIHLMCLLVFRKIRVNNAPDTKDIPAYREGKIS